MRLPALVAPLALLAACGSIPTKTLEIETIDLSDRPVPCLVVIDQDWSQANLSNHYTHAKGNQKLSVTVPFAQPEVRVTVIPIRVGTDGNSVEKVPTHEADAYGFRHDERFVMLADPASQLFILKQK